MAAPRINQRLAVIGAFLALITLAVFWTLLSCEFITFDDDLYVTANIHTQAGLTWEGVKWAFHSTTTSNWLPLTWMSHMLDCQWWGLKPVGHHLTNLLFHIANAVLLLLCLHRLTGALWRSALVAALFAWHPLHVESVAWVAERKDVLSTFFWMLALLAYAGYSGRAKIKNPKSRNYYYLTLLCFTLGLMSKPMVVTLPCVLLLLDFWPLVRVSAIRSQAEIFSTWKPLILEKLPFFALAGASSLITIFAQDQGGAVVNSMDTLTVEDRVANALVCYVEYLRKTIWPSGLAIFYPHPITWPISQVGLAITVLSVITFVAVKWVRSRPYFAVGWFWFLGTLVPVIGLVQVGGQSMADRYSYVPLIGIFIMAAWSAGDLVMSWPSLKMPTVVVIGLGLAGCIGATTIQLAYWRTSETVFQRDLKIAGDNYPVICDLAGYLLVEGRMKEALVYYQKALHLRPGADAEANLGDTYLQLGQLDQAAEHLNHALKLNPNHPQARFSRGELYAQEKRNAEAIAEFREVLRLRPGWPVVQAALSKALVEQGDIKGAADQSAAAAQGDTQNPQIEEQLGSLLAQQQRVPDAIEHYQEAVRRYRNILRHYPDYPEMLNNLAWLLATNPNAEIRNGTEAVTLARHATELTHREQPIMLGTLAAAYAEAGQFDEAIKTAETARDLAQKAGQTETADRNEALIKIYQAHKPYREAY